MFGIIEYDITIPRYAIRRKPDGQVNVDWYFRGFDGQVSTAFVWVKRVQSAKIFYDEESVEEFKYTFLRNRPCDIVLVGAS
jgi:hypothetical protein